jgi:hypothetical protein
LAPQLPTLPENIQQRVGWVRQDQACHHRSAPMASLATSSALGSCWPRYPSLQRRKSDSRGDRFRTCSRMARAEIFSLTRPVP